ncbi:MAG: hypothetical protein ACOYVD_09275 [Bacillota bacterium]
MESYLEKPTLDERLEAYKETKDFEADVVWLENGYRQHGLDIPPLEALRSETIKNQREWLIKLEHCQTEGHLLKETADPENGTSDLYCDRCGFSQRLYW